MAEKDPLREKYEPVKVSISFWANPKSQEINTEELGRGNFQWVEYGLLFKVKDGEDYYAYSTHLSSDGNIKEPTAIYKSDSEGVLYKNEKIELIPEDVFRLLPKLFPGRKPDLIPTRKATTIYRNTYKTDHGNTYSSEKFKEQFDKDYYVVVSQKPVLKNPFGETLGKRGAPPEKTEESKSADSIVDYYRGVVHLARKRKNQNKPFSGGFDIMKKFQEQQTGRKIDPGYSGGFNLLQRWQKKRQKGKVPAPSRGFDIVRVWQRKKEEK